MFNLFKLLHIVMRSLYISILCSEAYHVNWLSKLHVNDFGLVFSLSLSWYFNVQWHRHMTWYRTVYTQKNTNKHSNTDGVRWKVPYSLEKDINYAETKWKGEKEPFIEYLSIVFAVIFEPILPYWCIKYAR